MDDDDFDLPYEVPNYEPLLVGEVQAPASLIAELFHPKTTAQSSPPLLFDEKLDVPMGDLPHEQSLKLNIFCRLPVRSILRFRSVCKSWFSLLTSPNFIHEHLISSKDDPKKLSLIVQLCKTFFFSPTLPLDAPIIHYDPTLPLDAPIIHYDPTYSVLSIPLHSILHNNSSSPPPPPPHHHQSSSSNNNYSSCHELESGARGIAVGCHCDGLFFSTYTDFDPLENYWGKYRRKYEYTYLWNPYLQETRRLPPPVERIIYYRKGFRYGIGYDQTADDYKLVMVECGRDHPGILVFLLKWG